MPATAVESGCKDREPRNKVSNHRGPKSKGQDWFRGRNRQAERQQFRRMRSQTDGWQCKRSVPTAGLCWVETPGTVRSSLAISALTYTLDMHHWHCRVQCLLFYGLQMKECSTLSSVWCLIRSWTWLSWYDLHIPMFQQFQFIFDKFIGYHFFYF